MDEREDRIEAALAEYLEAVEAGKQPDRAAFLRRHPEAATELAAYFADDEKFAAVAGRLFVPPRSLPAGERVSYFGDYELLDQIATGGMGVVYRARQTSLQRTVALKTIRAGALASPAQVQGFRREAEAAANLDHPHIVPIYEVGEHGGQHYFSMKLLEGGRFLGDRKGRAATAEEQRPLAATLAKVARAIQFAHERGVLHRDLKPDNILLDEGGEPYVADFGLAKRLDVEASIHGAGAVVGTLAYMAPEQARSEKSLTVAADVYGLGAVLFEALCGRTPFTGTSVPAMLRQVAEDEAPSPRSLNAAVHPDLEAVCRKCLAKAPGDRYPSAKDLAEDLERFAKGEAVHARPASLGRAFGRWFRANLAAATTVAVVGFLGGLLLAAPDFNRWGGWKSVKEMWIQNADGTRSLKATIEKQYGTHDLAIPAILGSTFLAIWLVKPQRRAGDLATGAATGLVVVLTYLSFAGGAAISSQNRWVLWEGKLQNAIDSVRVEKDAEKVDTMLRAAQREMRETVAVSLRGALTSSLFYVFACAVAGLYAGRVRRERGPGAARWIAAGLALSLTGGLIKAFGPAEGHGSTIGFAMQFGVLIFAYYLYELVLSTPLAVRMTAVGWMVSLWIFNRAKGWIAPEWQDLARETWLAAGIVILVVAALTDGVPDEAEAPEPEQEETPGEEKPGGAKKSSSANEMTAALPPS
ncbi:MAG TPA: serine/threonine-protein kinase [Planctomycetia bacterium]|nr:serine/threonine-protein kinase [Planctomycetia bacterium]